MSKNQQNSGFSDVDRSTTPQSFIDCLDEQYAINGNLILKKYSLLMSRALWQQQKPMPPIEIGV
jgi:hypothetical protein